MKAKKKNRFDTRDGFDMVLDGKRKNVLLFNYGLFDKICSKIEYIISKKVILRIILIITLEGSE